MILVGESSLEPVEALREARHRTMELLADLPDELLRVPLAECINPPLWEFAHVAWFQEYWVLRRLFGEPPIDPSNDRLYDSAAVAHDARWTLPLLDRRGTVDYLERTLERVVDALRLRSSRATAYFAALATFHEDMHAEALIYARQFLGYPAPSFVGFERSVPAAGGALPGDTEIPGGEMVLGARPEDGFAFDNEKWGHPVSVDPFRIARAPVTNAEYRRFVDDGGYLRRELWSDEGWAWRLSRDATHPTYWRRSDDGGWQRRYFDRWVPVRDDEPVVHVCWHEAQAYCRWAGRRLPTEREWEFAASVTPEGEKRRYPWGNDEPTESRANLDRVFGDVVDVGAFPEGESPWGCRQMLGNVWEWTADAFGPYPGYLTDPYAEYSKPWFGTHKVLRGGAWTTRARMIRATWRNFYLPHRTDVVAGFRTCAQG